MPRIIQKLPPECRTFGLITLYQNRRRVFGLAGSRKEQVLGMLFPNLGLIETTPIWFTGRTNTIFNVRNCGVLFHEASGWPKDPEISEMGQEGSPRFPHQIKTLSTCAARGRTTSAGERIPMFTRVYGFSFPPFGKVIARPEFPSFPRNRHFVARLYDKFETVLRHVVLRLARIPYRVCATVHTYFAARADAVWEWSPIG